MHGVPVLKLISLYYHVVTTDVQGIAVCRVGNSTTVIINCIFLDGSSNDSRCMYVLVSSQGNITGSTEKGDTQGQRRNIADKDVSGLLAYDADLMLDSNTIYDLGLVVRRRIVNIAACPNAFIPGKMSYNHRNEWRQP